jgi:lipid II:glycine glycyltransferase (peptidoglycan interpeptide bridge formation enzyme)
LALEKDFDQLTKKFKRTVRQSVRKAVESKLEVLKGKNEIDLKKFYGLYNETRKRNCVPAQPYLFFYNLWSKFSPTGHLTLVLVNKENTTVGAGMLLKFKQRVTLEFLASDSRFLALRPNHLIAWNAIKSAQEEGYKIFDFGRTAPEDQGLMRFKRSWGTAIVDLMMASGAEENKSSAYDRNGLGWKTVSYLSGKLPHSLYGMFSNYCYRHLG